ncbi:MAG: transcriptional repressor [Pelagibacteraceae bacterium]|nr:transcriptional repressor [Pelagibacteraceae bacterium]PHX89073.1 MAG: transcriptional repressor [Pelagibacteraceae bacterium]
MDFADKLRASGLRPTKQRLRICKTLFDRDKTFHFLVKDLVETLNEKTEDQKISVATVYNTVHAFKKSGYLKQLNIDPNHNYFDTNISHHHHFFDESTKELIDLNNDQVEKIEIKKTLPGKTISSVEILVKVENK